MFIITTSTALIHLYSDKSIFQNNAYEKKSGGLGPLLVALLKDTHKSLKTIRLSFK